MSILVDSYSIYRNSFTFTVKTDNTGTSNDDQFSVPTISGGTYNCTIYRGDGSSSDITTWDDAAWTHTYSSSGTYVVRIVGTFKGWKFDNGGDKEKLLNISQWGVLEPFAVSAFYGCSNLTITATDILNTSTTTDLTHLFRGCSSITSIPNMNNWDISNVTALTNFVFGATNWDENINDWDISSLTSMSAVFNGASSFDQPLSGWDVSSISTFTSCFQSCSSFNQDISSWDMSSATTLWAMFNQATSFNQDISGWDVSSVTSMVSMFINAPIDQDLGSWNVTSLTDATNMFLSVTLSTANCNSIIEGWEAQAVQNSVTLNLGNSTWSGADAAQGRFNLVNDHSWTVTDAGAINQFTISVKTDNSGTSTSTQFKVPTVSGGSYDCFVEWKSNEGDRISTYDDADWTHEFTSASTYEVSIYGTFTGWKFNNGGDKNKLTVISQWGSFNSNNEMNVFYGCTNLTITATDVIDLTGVTTMFGFFRSCTSLVSISNSSNWDVSGITAMLNTFFGCTSFNDSGIVSWDMSNVTDITNLLRQTAFNQDIGSWNVSSLTNMKQAFMSNTVFDQDISTWDTSNVANMEGAFNGATSFDRGLGALDVTSLTNATNMFNGVTLSTANYDSLLVGMEGQAVQDSVPFNGGNSTYTGAGAGGTARAALISDHTWTFIDGGAV